MRSLVQVILLASTAHAAVLKGVNPKFPFDPETSAWCTWWYDNEDGGITCEEIPAYWGITEEQWKRWNPSLAESCDNFETGKSYCVDSQEPDPEPPTTTTTEPPISTTSLPPTTTTSVPDNGIETPQPTQPGMVNDCDEFHFIQSGDSCAEIADTYGITIDQFLEWNPKVGGAECTGLWLDAYVCVSIIGHEPEPSPTDPDNGIETPQPTQPGMVDNCDAFHLIESGDSCAAIADSYGITIDQFLEWNPKVGGADCTGLWLDSYVCVSIIGHESTPTDPGNGIETPLPTQPGMVDNCDAFHLVESGDSCRVIAESNGITIEEFLEWNPKVGGADCTGLWLDNYVCVSIIGHEPTPTGPGNGIETPLPTQPGMVDNCDDFHLVESGDSCASIAKDSGITVQEFLKWNPEVGGTACTGLWLDAYVCISIIGHEPTPTDPGNGIETPSPIQDGMTPNCNKFHFIKKGQTCEDIVSQYKITLANFVKWNPAAGKDCSGLWAETYACVGVL